MADPRTSFMILEDSGTEAGVPLHKVLEGDAIAAKNALPSLTAKVAGTNLFAYLKTNASTGALLVDNEAATSCLKAKGELAAGSATNVLVTGASITLVASKVYQNVGFIVSSRRDSLFQIIHSDNAVESVIGEVVVGSGQYTVSSQIHCFKFTAGATGPQLLIVKAKNFEALSSLRAAIVVEEIQ